MQDKLSVKEYEDPFKDICAHLSRSGKGKKFRQTFTLRISTKIG